MATTQLTAVAAVEPSDALIKDATNPIDTGRHTFHLVQVLRGVAAGMVLTHHATQAWISKVGGIAQNSGWANGAAGVDIFFAISGFVMVISTSGRKRPTSAQFLGRRLIRIAPLYWALSLLALLADVIKSFAGSSVMRTLSVPYVLSSMAFLPYKLPNGQTSVVVTGGWTLCFEMLFYVLFSLTLLFKVSPLRLLAPIMILLASLSVFHQPSWPGIGLFLNPILLEFLGGILLANAVLSGFRPSRKLAALAGIAGAILLLVTPDFDSLAVTWRALIWGLPALLLVAGVIFWEQSAKPAVSGPMLAVGNASYSLYLIHPFIIPVILMVFLRYRTCYGIGVVFVIASISVSILAAHFMFKFFEQPVSKRLRRIAGLGR